MNVTCQLRPATIADEDFVYALYFHPAVNAALLYDPMSSEEFHPIYMNLLAQGIKYIFECNGQAVGMAKLVPNTYRTSHVCYVGGIAIQPEQNGQGFGSLLMQSIIAWAKQHGYWRLELDVDEDNPKAKHVYEKAGFVTEGTLKNLAFRKTDGRYYDNYRMAIWLGE